MIYLSFVKDGEKQKDEVYKTIDEAIGRIVKVYEKDRKAIGAPKYDGRLELRGINADNIKEAGIIASFANRIANNDATIKRQLTTKEIEKSVKITQDQTKNIDKVNEIDLIRSETNPLWTDSLELLFTVDGIVIKEKVKEVKTADKVIKDGSIT